MKAEKNYGRYLIEEASLKINPISNLPVVEITGKSRIVIENHQGIILYTDQEIRVKVKKGIICFNGKELKISCVSRHYLIISGNLESVLFMGED